MRLTLLSIALVAVSACALPAPTTPSLAGSGPYRFSGTVSGMDGVRIGAPIAGAELTVVSGPNLHAHVSSDGAGHFSFEALETGKFTVAIDAPGFVSATPVVNLYRDVDANFALQPR